MGNGPAPPLLTKVLSSVQAGKKIEVQAVLKELPIFKGLAQKGQENNHARDGAFPQDKVHRAWQTSVLNLMRIMACLFEGVAHLPDDDETKILFLQAFHLMGELENRIKTYRKQRSIPTSVQKAEEDVLFFERRSAKCAIPTKTRVSQDVEVWERHPRSKRGKRL